VRLVFLPGTSSRNFSYLCSSVFICGLYFRFGAARVDYGSAATARNTHAFRSALALHLVRESAASQLRGR